MREDFWFDSCGAGRIHVCRWMPEAEPKAVFQIVHGIAEVAERYDAFAQVLAQRGFVVVADDHMGHGQSVGEGDTNGYFTGGWFSAVADSYHLLELTKAEFPNLPYVLFGHSMGSFMARTILCKYPDSGIDAAIICGTGWQPAFALPAVIKVVESVCKKVGETNPNETLHKLVFGGYNRKVEHPRTEFDWLTRDTRIVDAYIAHPMCGFTETTGLLRDLMTAALDCFRKDDPVAAQLVEPLEETMDCLTEEVRNRHIHRLQNGQCTIQLGFVLNDLLNNFERIGDHCSNIAVSVIEEQDSQMASHAYLHDMKKNGEFAARLQNNLSRYALPPEMPGASPAEPAE